MTEPNTTFLGENIQVLELAGKKWPVPLLAPRQNRIVVPKLMRLLKQLFPGGQVRTGIDWIDDPLTTEVLDDLYEVVFIALTRAHPDFKRTEFDDMPISPFEAMRALLPIAEATGVLVRTGGSKEPAEEPQPGEVQAGS